LGDFQDTLILLGLKKLEKYFPKKLETDWQNYQSYIFAMLLDPRGKHHLLKTLKFDNEAIRDVIRGKKFTTHRYGWVTPKRYTQPNATVGPRNWAANKISQPFFTFTPKGETLGKEHHSNVYTLWHCRPRTEKNGFF
jgi:hypothetical protein